MLSLCNLLGYWSEKKHQMEFLNYAAKELGVKTLEDWYNISRYKLVEVRSKNRLKY